MAYNSLIPKSTDQLSLSQGDILSNFTALGAIAGNGKPASSSINTSGGVGQPSGFNWIYLPTNGSIPPAGSAFPAAQIALYSAVDPITSKNELYINKTNQATVVQVAATSSILSIVSAQAPGAFGNMGWTMLPSGIKFVWGVGQGSNIGPVTITLVGSQVFATTILSVQCTIINPSATFSQAFVRVQSFSGANSFDAVVSGATATSFNNSRFTYLAIGY